MEQAKKISRALISVSDKTGLLELAQFFREENILMLSTGGTASFLRENKFLVTEVESLTQFPEILDGRVKTLHPKVYGGILFDRDKENHRSTLAQMDIPPIDLVVCNLYPFDEAAKNEQPLKELVEKIDIGGPCMLRAAAKNFAHLSVLSSPTDYEEFIQLYKAHFGVPLSYRQNLAVKAFRHTKNYDDMIANTLYKKFFVNNELCSSVSSQFLKTLRYGENPHQSASVHIANSLNKNELSIAEIASPCGKELSYNNMLDGQAAIWSLRCLMQLENNNSQGAVVIKHGVPCGAAVHEQMDLALKMAIESDPKSAFGGIVALSDQCDEKCAKIINETFFEVIIAPSFSEEALAILKQRANLRLIASPGLLSLPLPKITARSIFGGFLVQEQDDGLIHEELWQVVSKRQVDKEEMEALRMAYKMVIPCPSNAISLASNCQLLGIGAGQPNRILSVEIAIKNAKERGFNFKDAALASDAFFPFDDCLSLAASEGIGLFIQPGGSINDKKIIKKADELGVAMVLTQRRHFKH